MANFNDKILQFSDELDSREMTFLSVDRVEPVNILNLNPTAYFQSQFRLINRVKEYQRRIYSIFDFFGDLGGFIEAIFVAGQFMVAGLASRMFKASLIRDLFHVRMDTKGADIGRLLKKISGKN